MIQMRTWLTVADNSGARKLMCILPVGGDVGLKAGLVIGVVTAIVTPWSPFIEWGADHVPEKRMGVYGIGLILIGFALQSIQYWVALLDVSIR